MSSGNALFDRRCRLTIVTPVSTPNDFKNVTSDVVEIDGGVSDDRLAAGMRITFKIKKKLKKEPNTGEIEVYNLNQDRRSSLQQKGVKVRLEAGYKDTGFTQYFAGDVRTVDHIRKDGDWVTTLRLGDGERAWNYARVSESFAPGTLKGDVLRAVGKALGVEAGNLEKQAARLSGAFDQGFTAFGSTARSMELLVTSLGLNWSIQDGQIQILKLDEVLDLPVEEITPDTGLVGSPEMGTPTKKGGPALVQFTALLRPTKPGAKVKLSSERYPTGFVKVVNCDFDGDTMGGEWYTKIDGEVLK